MPFPRITHTPTTSYPQPHTTNASLNLEQDVCVSGFRPPASKERLSPVSSAACHNMLESLGLAPTTPMCCLSSPCWMLDHGGHAPRQHLKLPTCTRLCSRGLMLYAAPSGLCHFGTGLLPTRRKLGVEIIRTATRKRSVVGLKNRPPAARHSGPHPVRTDGRLGLPPIRQPAASTTHRRSVFVSVPSSGQSSDGMHATASNE